MATVPFADPTLPYRVQILEDWRTRTDPVIEQYGQDIAAQRERDLGHGAAIAELRDSIKWNTRALVGLCVTIAGSAVGLALASPFA